MDLVAHLRQCLSAVAEWQESDRLLVAVSGGRDSVVLGQLCRDAGLPFSVVHVNFQLRGEESEADEAFVRQLAKRWKAPCLVNHVDTVAYKNERGLSTQEAAQQLRYGWFDQLVAQGHGRWVLLAHHQADQGETLLLNLLRGTGLKGLTGMPAQRGHFLRPLLGVPREALNDLLVDQQLQWREDSSNASTAYLRNQLRLEVTPLLRQAQPQLDHGLANTAQRLQGARGLLEHFLQGWAAQAVTREDAAVFIAVGDLPADDQVARELLTWVLGDYGFSPHQVGQLVAGRGQSGRTFASTGWQLVEDRQQLVLTPTDGTPLGTQFIDQEAAQAAGFALSTLPAAAYSIEHKKHVAAVDAAKLRFPLEVRPWRQGDKFVPLGMSGKKKVSDFMIDAKIPLNLKDRQLVVCSGGKVVWLVGLRLDDRYKITEQTQTVYRMETTHGVAE